MSPAPSLPARLLEPFAGGLWVAFWVWTVLAAVFWIAGVEGGGEMGGWLARHFPVHGEGAPRSESPLQSAAELLGAAIDPIWMMLAAASCYGSLAAEQGLDRARRWTLWILLGAFAVAAATVWTGWPLGPILFTTRFGPSLGPVPLGWLLLWVALVLGARETVRWAFPRASHAKMAWGAGLLAMLTEWSLRGPAARVRVLWMWRAGAEPWWTCVAWFFLAAMLAYLLRSGAGTQRPGRRGALVFLALNAVFLLTRAVR